MSSDNGAYYVLKRNHWKLFPKIILGSFVLQPHLNYVQVALIKLLFSAVKKFENN